ncbi:MAG TPA: cupin domain-containing protein [Thermohalobaculum sp.]|nr:cupin domain-containing protein [Thermohalobaculum sp.]
MQPIKPAERRVANLRTADFVPWDPEGISERGTSILQLNPAQPRGVGFYIYKMEPGAHSAPHVHGGAEEFVVIDGEIIDNDGTVYRSGDVVWLAPGTEHTSHAPNGALIAVYAEAGETEVPAP